MKSKVVVPGLSVPMSRYVLIAALLLSVLVLAAGCASSPGTPEAKSTVYEENFAGFLDDYSRLEPIEGEPSVLIWMNPEAQLKDYNTFIVDPVVMEIAPALAQGERPDPESAARITEYFREALIRELGKHAVLTDTPGEGVGRLQAAITGAQVTSQELDAWQFVPVALLVTGAAEVTGTRDKASVLFMEAKMTDSVTGELVAETVQQGVGRVSGGTDTRKLTKDDVQKILDHWAQRLGNRVAKIQAGD